MNIRYRANSYCFSSHALTGSSNPVRRLSVVKDLSESSDLKESV